jgi:Cu/Ag efflux protein CusF
MMIAAFLSLMLVPQTVAKADTISAVATIQAIDTAKRLVTIKDEDGIEDTIYVEPEIKRFNELKVGDKVKAQYHESVVLQLRKPGDPAKASTDTTALSAGAGKSPGAALARQVTTTVTVVSIDDKTPSLTVKTEDGRTLTRKVEDRKNLVGVKAGDHIDIIYTQAAMVDIIPVK